MSALLRPDHSDTSLPHPDRVENEAAPHARFAAPALGQLQPAAGAPRPGPGGGHLRQRAAGLLRQRLGLGGQPPHVRLQQAQAVLQLGDARPQRVRLLGPEWWWWLLVAPPVGHARARACHAPSKAGKKRGGPRSKKGEPLKPLEPLQPRPDPVQRASEILTDPELGRLLDAPREVPEIERARQIFVNRNLRMANVELIGFDMDYTLAIYHLRRIEQLSFDMTLAAAGDASAGYPEAIGAAPVRPQLRDARAGGRQGRTATCSRWTASATWAAPTTAAAAGRRDAASASTGNERIRLKNPQYAWIDTLFALPEACLFAGIIDLLERPRADSVDYGRLYDDIRESIDTVHRDNSLKRRDPQGHRPLHLQGPGAGAGAAQAALGRQEAVPAHQLALGLHRRGDALPARRRGARVPRLAELLRPGGDRRLASPPSSPSGRPFLELDAGHRRDARAAARRSAAGARQGLPGRQPARASSGSPASPARSVLYVGDHIYGDILRSPRRRRCGAPAWWCRRSRTRSTTPTGADEDIAALVGAGAAAARGSTTR